MRHLRTWEPFIVAKSKWTSTTGQAFVCRRGERDDCDQDEPGIKDSCANAFNGPLKLVGGGTTALSASGPNATVAFDGLLPTSSLGSSKIAMTDGGDPAKREEARTRWP
jgi:hypothetical protein